MFSIKPYLVDSRIVLPDININELLASYQEYAAKKKKNYSSSVGKLDQAGRPASAWTGLYRQKGKINPGDTGSQPRQLHISRDI
jgi:hypothetical protein